MAARSVPSSRVDLARLCAVFVAVAEERHFGAAADRLGTAQPTVSQGLARLEAHLGVSLLERTREGAVLTTAGRQLLPLARTVGRDVAHLESRARELATNGLSTGLGASSTTPVPLAAAAAAELRTAAGTVRMARGDGPDLVAAVESAELDAAIVDDPSPTGDLVRGVLHRLPRRLAIPADAPTGGGARIPWRELRGLELVTPPRAAGPAAWDLVVDLVRDSGIEPRTLEVAGTADLLPAVAAGTAFAVVDATQAEVDGVRLHALPERFDQRFRALVHPERQRTAGGHDLRSLVDRGLTRACRAVIARAGGQQ